ncbi:MAG: hypothetical protein EA349_14850 [Halomonadaceae bacterium]|nr:MAG: hypothetical protein EA349_14850 [Halomonadaceae bacterium]
MIRSLCAALACTLLPLATLASADPAGAPINHESLNRAWSPLMTLAGDGDRDRALEQLDEYRQLRERMIGNMEVHQDTHEFLESFWASLERFDLQRLHDLLPEQKSLGARSLTVSGRTLDNRYRIAPKAEVRTDDAGGHPLEIGDFDTQFQSLSLKNVRKQRFLLGIESRLAIGQLTQVGIAQSAQRYVSAQTQPDEDFVGEPREYWQEQVRERHPHLSDHETEVLAPWPMAFPGVWKSLTHLGRIDGLLTTPNGRGSRYQYADAGFTLDTDLIDSDYPGLARHLARLGSLFRVEGELNTGDGRLIRFRLDTDSLSGALEAVLDQGIPLAKTNNSLADVEATMAALGNLTAVMDVRINVLGVIAHLNNLEADLSLRSRSGGGDIHAAITRMPDIHVEGRALGMIPTGMIDFFIPGSLKVIIEEFLEVAVTGNQGRGITASIQLDEDAQGSSSLLGFEGHFEALDNFFVRLGMRMVNRRVIPDEDASDDIRQLIYDLNQSFSEDMDRYRMLTD